MIALGFWQLQRASDKEALLDLAQSARQTPVVAIETIDNVIDASRQLTRVVAIGEYLSDRQFLWDNRTFQGRAGYEVITPLRLATGRLVLVNRGWIEQGATRAQLPVVALPASVVGKKVQTTGLLSRPSKGFAGGDAMQPSPHWPKVLQYFDYNAMAEALDEPLIAGIVQPQEKNDPGSQAEFYTAAWQPAATLGPAKHYSYAFQWFAMSVALSVLFIVNSIRKPDNGTT